MDKLVSAEKKLYLDKSNWQLTKLGDLAKEISNRVDNPAQSEYQRFVGLEHFVSGDLKIKNWGATDDLASAAKAFKKGDILFARRNAYLRRASIVEFDGCCSGDAFVLKENHEKVVPGFLAFVMNSSSLWDFANSNAAGTMSKRVKWSDLAEYEFLLPSKDTQTKLAELVWALDKVLDALNYLSIKDYLLSQSLVNSFFKRNKLSYSNLDTMADIKYGITLNSKKNSLGINVPYLRVANVSRGSVTLDELKTLECT